MNERMEPDRRPLIPWWPASPLAGPTRIPARGPARLALLVLLTLGWVSLAGSMMLAGIGQPIGLLLLAAGVLATSLIAVLRAWALGTYVDDRGFAVREFWRNRHGAWSTVAAVEVGEGQVRLLTRDEAGTVTSITTHVRRWSVDLLGSRDGYQAAADRLCRWQAGQ